MNRVVLVVIIVLTVAAGVAVQPVKAPGITSFLFYLNSPSY